MEYIRVRESEVYHRILGEGRPVIFLHGNPADHRSMLVAFEPIFAGRPGWKRIYFDLPGMGQTRGAEWITSMDRMLEFVLAFIDELIPGERFLVVGESFGGYLARGIVHFKANLIDGMFLLVPSVKPGASDRQIPEGRIIHADQEFIASLSDEERRMLGEVSTVHTREIAERLQELYISAMRMSDQKYLGRLRGQYAFTFDLNNPAPRHEFPALILAGRQDTIVGYADQMELHAYFPRGTVVVLDRAGHVPELDQPGLFTAFTSEWLDRVEEFVKMRETV